MVGAVVVVLTVVGTSIVVRTVVLTMVDAVTDVVVVAAADELTVVDTPWCSRGASGAKRAGWS